ncbi:MAG: Na+/H+ antiporter NhaA [Planctomycetes bacterium]|nr:Na+/H+ antiporter NhaA [Planctomycetota bacterium]
MASPPHVPNTERRPIDWFLAPVQRFLRVEAMGGLLLLGCTVLAMAWANSPWHESYEHFWHTYLTLGFGDFKIKLSLAHFVNDGLMAIFFFVVGLEIKREILVGELASFRKAAVPIAAAVGGMVVPALIYFAINPSGNDSDGWAIPMATDIAFAVGIMAILGRRVPLALKVFVTALAIVDDLGAVLVIAFFYSDGIAMQALVSALALLAIAFVLGRLGVRAPLVYAVIGFFMWNNLLTSGVHATIGGVLLAFTIPSKVRIKGARFAHFARESIDNFEESGGSVDDIMTNPDAQHSVHGLELACEHVQTPLRRLEHILHPWVAFVIMPIFALANAGIYLGAGFGNAVGSGVGAGIGFGLVLGKPIGVALFTLLAVKTGLGDLPKGATWRQVIGAGFLAGIGFTMSLFIANLAFRTADEKDLLLIAKAGILCGSLIAGIVGFVMLYRSKPADDSTGSER